MVDSILDFAAQRTQRSANNEHLAPMAFQPFEPSLGHQVRRYSALTAGRLADRREFRLGRGGLHYPLRSAYTISGQQSLETVASTTLMSARDGGSEHCGGSFKLYLTSVTGTLDS